MASGSSTTGNVLGAIGAVVGFIYGGPVGAAQGYAIGSSIGNSLDPPKGPTQEGPRLSDLTLQTSTYGAFIPRIYGRIAVNGNIFWLEKNKLKEVVRKKKSGGKGGGGGATVKTYNYYATCAIGLCEGPVDGIRRIWAGPNLIYDAGSDSLESIIASNQAAKGFSFYLGTDSQLPDSRIQADLGVSNTSAYRGLCYVVVKDFPLEKYGNAIPPFKVEVLTSASAGMTRTILDEVVIDRSADSANAGLLMSGAIPDEDGAGCTVSDGMQSPMLSSDFSLDGRAIKTQAYTLLGPIVDMPQSFSSDDGGFAVWTGSLVSGQPWQTADGLVYSGAVSQLSGKLIKSSGKYYYFEKEGTVARRCSYFLGLETSYSVPAAIGHCAHGSTAYCVSQGLDSLYLINLDDFSVSSIAINSSSFTGINAQFQNTLLSYSSGDHLYLCGLRNDVAACRVFQVSTTTGDIAIWADIPLYPGANSRGCIRVSGDLLYRLSYGDAGSSFKQKAYYSVFQRNPQSVGNVLLSEIIESECQRTGLIGAADISTAGMSDSVAGYRVSKISSVRAVIEPLRGAFPFDVVQSGYAIKFLPRGNSSSVQIDCGSLGVDEQIRQVREMDSQLPRKTVVTYLDSGRNYDVNEQSFERPETDAVNTRSLEIPVVMGSTQALQVAERLNYLHWLERTDFGPIILPPEYSYLEPADVITIDAGYAVYELRLITIKHNQNGSIECSARLNNAAVYQSDAGSVDVPDNGQVEFSGGSYFEPLDIPVVDESLQNTSGIVAAMTGYTSGWPGGIFYRSLDQGQTWTDVQAFSAKCSIGFVRDSLAYNKCGLIQEGGSITVDMLSGELESITEAQMLNGGNYCAYGADGRWEIIRFQNVTLNADGSYTVSRFIRGDKGTEWATGLHLSGDSFVILSDPDNAFVGYPSELIGSPSVVRGVTSGSDIDSSADDSFIYQGVNLAPLSPRHAAGVRDLSGNIAISWIRRTRIGGEWRSNVDASLGESIEAYEIDVMDGSSVKRTINSATQSATYTAADQAADFGAPQSSVTVRIYQMSATVGRGYPLEVTL